MSLLTTLNNILPFGGTLYLVKGYYPSAKAQQIFDVLFSSLAWQQETIYVYGRWIKVPRLMCWYGDIGANYHYSGVKHFPLLWTQPLAAINQKIESDFNCAFNSVMANLYRDGSDSMGCHADDEKELGRNPMIASLSLGGQRRLKFRHNQGKEVIDIMLENGDLLLMAGEIQHHWKHELPKTKKTVSARINLTFRQVLLLDKECA